MRSIADKVVVVTGASQGIGAAIAKQFAAENSRLVLCGRNKERLDEINEEIGFGPDRSLLVVSDLTKPGGVKTIVDDAINKFGRIDIFVNNAGVGVAKPISEMTESEFDTIFATNVKAVFLSFKELLPVMQRQGSGQIINISSGAGRTGMPGLAAYSASKAALNALSEAVGGEVRNEGIKVSVLSPGSTDTNFRFNMSGDSKPSSAAKQKLTVDEVAEAVVFLARQNRNAWTAMADLRPLLVKK
ncbi:MAG: SDR family NAD(P)-dependent oxidoreductase [bacterium]|nr:SDR family NAD(P)-dependent oxidoreductase [bacterium]